MTTAERSAAVYDGTKTRDYLVRDLVFAGTDKTPPAGTLPWTRYNFNKVKPGMGNAYRAAWEKYNKPVLDRLVAESEDNVGRFAEEGLADAVLKKAFTLAVGDNKPGQGGVELDNGNYVIVMVTARRPGAAASNTEARDALRRQLLTIRADQALTAQLAALRERYPVRVLQAAEQ